MPQPGRFGTDRAWRKRMHSPLSARLSVFTQHSDVFGHFFRLGRNENRVQMPATDEAGYIASFGFALKS